MVPQRLLLLVGALACSFTTAAHRQPRQSTPFSCSGGSVYFSAHPVDVLLFQNPDLFHDLWVFKCVTAVVFTSGHHPVADGSSTALENGLGHAFLQMTGMPVHTKAPLPNTINVQLGEHEVAMWTPPMIPRFHIVYLRLPNGGHAGQGYDAYHEQSLKKLWDRDIDNITTINGNATYTLDLLQDLVATILRQRQPNDVKMMHHEAALPENQNDDEAEHADHTISAKLVMHVIERENISANIQRYAGGVMRSLDSTMKSSDRDYHRKKKAFFRYAVFDKHMCESIEVCQSRLHGMGQDDQMDHDATYAALYLEREYYVA